MKFVGSCQLDGVPYTPSLLPRQHSAYFWAIGVLISTKLPARSILHGNCNTIIMPTENFTVTKKHILGNKQYTGNTLCY